MNLTLPATRENIPKARHAVSDFAEGCQADSMDVATAVTEAVSNTVLHAYRGGMPPGDVRISARRSAEELVVIVEDDGVGMKPHLESEGLGMGCVLIKSFCKEVTFGNPGKGVRVTMHFPCRDRALA
jgi:anti-sigma regulatory factor (Ser/Thr protein kinase)